MNGYYSSKKSDKISDINFYRGYRYFLGNMDNYKKALLATNKSVKSKISLLQAMIRTGEYEGLRSIVQTLRIMMNNIGADGLSEMSYKIEVILLNEEYDILHDILKAYQQHLEEFITELLPMLIDFDNLNDFAVNTDQNSFLNYDFTKTHESIKQSQRWIERNII